jgi:hypothetical protein
MKSITTTDIQNRLAECKTQEDVKIVMRNYPTRVQASLRIFVDGVSGSEPDNYVTSDLEIVIDND